MAICQICKRLDASVERIGAEDSVHVRCLVCGCFHASDTLWSVLDHREENAKLSAYVREHNLFKSDELVLGYQFVVDNKLSDYSVSDKQKKLMKALAKRSPYAGAAVAIKLELDYPLGWAINAGEFRWQIESLGKLGLVDLYPGNWELYLTVKGYKFLEETQDKGAESNRVFVAMSFDSSMWSAWENGIAPAVRDAGYIPYRVDEQPHNDRIDAKIISEIRESKFLIADVTQHKQGVYFEAGYAMGLGKPVFWSVKKDDLEKAHFDTRQFYHVVWTDEADLREKMSVYILALLGRAQ